MLGTLLATRYKIIRILGTGGFGQTYIAEDTQRPSPLICVVKHLRPNNQDADFLKVARRLFDTEVETLRRLGQHEQIPALLDSFEEDGEFYFVQEYIDGFPLSEEISGRFQLSEDQVIAVLDDVLQVLDFVHANNVIHRDIKPGNLIRRRDGKLVLIDFGAVKEIQTQLTTAPTGTSSGQTGFTVGIGTQGYTPSEQLAGRPRYSSDLYALGVTAIQMLTGLMPHEIAEHPHTGELMWEDYANASPGLKLLLSKMIRQHVAYRYAAASEVQRDLQRLDELPADSSFRQPHDLTRLPDLETRQQRLSAGIKAIALASVATLCLCLGIRQIGGFEPLEVRAFDQMMRSRPDLPPDSRLLVVEITEADLRQLGRRQGPHRAAVELARRGEGDVVDVHVQAHADGIGGDQIVHLASLVHGHLRVACARTEGAEHNAGAAALAADDFGQRVNVGGRKRDDGAARRQALQAARAGVAERRHAGAGLDLGLRDQPANQRPDRLGAHQHRLDIATGVQQPVRKDVAAIGIGAHLDLVDGEKRDAAAERHGFDGAQEIARVRRADLLLAGDQRDVARTFEAHRAVIVLASEQTQRKPDDPRGVREHALHRQEGLARVGRTEHGRDAGPGRIGSHDAMNNRVSVGAVQPGIRSPGTSAAPGCPPPKHLRPRQPPSPFPAPLVRCAGPPRSRRPDPSTRSGASPPASPSPCTPSTGPGRPARRRPASGR